MGNNLNHFCAEARDKGNGEVEEDQDAAAIVSRQTTKSAKKTRSVEAVLEIRSLKAITGSLDRVG